MARTSSAVCGGVAHGLEIAGLGSCRSTWGRGSLLGAACLYYSLFRTHLLVAVDPIHIARWTLHLSHPQSALRVQVVVATIKVFLHLTLSMPATHQQVGEGGPGWRGGKSGGMGWMGGGREG